MFPFQTHDIREGFITKWKTVKTCKNYKTIN